jgi:hypothetical protein
MDPFLGATATNEPAAVTPNLRGQTPSEGVQADTLGLIEVSISLFQPAVPLPSQIVRRVRLVADKNTFRK